MFKVASWANVNIPSRIVLLRLSHEINSFFGLQIPWKSLSAGELIYDAPHTSTGITDACTVWRHGTFPTTSRASPTPTAAVFGRRHPRSWWFDVHSCPPSAIEHFRWLVAASGTVCRLTLPQLQRWLFFGIASKLSFSSNHFLIKCFPFLVL